MFGILTFADLLADAGTVWTQMSVVFGLLGALYVTWRGARIARSLLS